ncbi:MAG TPA: hypothetical protein VGC76_12395 [Pyrinomonadaceae bacterium]|jgi:hypothetical protein
MENNDKIYPARISFSADWENFAGQAKSLFFDFLRFAKTLAIFALCASGFLILQLFCIGVFDRMGVSPKISFLISSVFYVAGFAGLAIGGGLKRKPAEIAGTNFNSRPICKMLIIKRKTREIKL